MPLLFTSVLLKMRTWKNVTHCCVTFQWLPVISFCTLAQEFRTGDDGLRQALAQIPVFPGKTLLSDAKCSSGTVCAFLSHYQCLWTSSSLLLHWHIWLLSKILLFLRGSKWCCNMILTAIAPLTVIFRHCFHPHLARMCIFYYIYQSLGVFVSHKNNLKKITVTLKYILEIHCKEGDKNGNWSEKMNKKTAHKVFHYTSYMFMFSK